MTQLGFKGALINGTTNGVFFDDKRFWPICERAAALDVPLYLHPTMPHAAVIDTYYKDYAQDWPMLLRAAWGFTVETATQGVRMVLSGVFDAYPKLKIILGHLGEGLPFLLWRIDMGFARGGGSRSFRDVFCEHFHITTSAASSPIRRCCAACRSWAWIASCSRSTIRSSPTSQVPTGCRPSRSVPRTRRRSPAAMRCGC